MNECLHNLYAKLITEVDSPIVSSDNNDDWIMEYNIAARHLAIFDINLLEEYHGLLYSLWLCRIERLMFLKRDYLDGFPIDNFQESDPTTSELRHMLTTYIHYLESGTKDWI